MTGKQYQVEQDGKKKYSFACMNRGMQLDKLQGMVVMVNRIVLSTSTKSNYHKSEHS